jgi:GxxExxY protein
MIKIIIELKALSAITSEHKAQVINYLKATNFELGIILNFGTAKLSTERIIREHSRHSMINEKESSNGAN